MRNLLELAIHIVVTLLKLSKPGGVKAIVTENIAMRQQLIVVNRKRKRTSNLTSGDRFIFGVVAGLISPRRLQKIAVVIKPATLLKFHKALVSKKYIPIKVKISLGIEAQHKKLSISLFRLNRKIHTTAIAE